MKLFWQLFKTDIPISGILITIILAFGSILFVLLNGRVKRKRHWSVYILFVSYLFLVLYTTVFGRSAGTNYLFCFRPFWSIEKIQQGFIETLYEKTYNILLFVPFGIILSLIRDVKCHQVLLTGCTISVFIELLQLITKTGVCETDDVICNSLGCFISYLLFMYLITIINKINK